MVTLELMLSLKLILVSEFWQELGRRSINIWGMLLGKVESLQMKLNLTTVQK